MAKCMCCESWELGDAPPSCVGRGSCHGFLNGCNCVRCQERERVEAEARERWRAEQSDRQTVGLSDRQTVIDQAEEESTDAA